MPGECAALQGLFRCLRSLPYLNRSEGGILSVHLNSLFSIVSTHTVLKALFVC